MILSDVNVLIYAFREDAVDHARFRNWLESVIADPEAFGVDLIADAFLAALAIEFGCEWITTDRDYSRFPGLRWRSPF